MNHWSRGRRSAKALQELCEVDVEAVRTSRNPHSATMATKYYILINKVVIDDVYKAITVK
ncbi:hypothetical protein JDW15_01155 [Aerococcaceae bacterium zg-ZJ1578]|nr:hypothetical protein [Aerococcaceae bacterium zg-1578]